MKKRDFQGAQIATLIVLFYFCQLGLIVQHSRNSFRIIWYFTNQPTDQTTTIIDFFLDNYFFRLNGCNKAIFPKSIIKCLNPIV